MQLSAYQMSESAIRELIANQLYALEIVIPIIFGTGSILDHRDLSYIHLGRKPRSTT
jgi:hypothetical protein